MALPWRTLLTVTLLSCSGSQAPAPAPPPALPPGPAPAPSARPELVFYGMCDASAAVPVDQRTFIVADDEDNVLRAYDVERPGPPLWSVDVSSGIGVSAKPAEPGKSQKAPPEADIEAATRLGNLAFWMTSHGRSSKAKLKPERLKLFATSVPSPGAAQLSIVGKPYSGLLDDLLGHPALEPFHLREAAELAPKAPGGLNLEGMAARLEGGVWMGFRNPVPGGKGLVISLLNPEQVVRGDKAELGEPRLLELGGWGVRALSQHGGRYLILAGPFASAPGARLYTWDGAGEPRLVAAEALNGLSPEGFFSPVGSADVLVLSDDGSVLIDGRECKALPDPAQKRFRARWLRP